MTRLVLWSLLRAVYSCISRVFTLFNLSVSRFFYSTRPIIAQLLTLLQLLIISRYELHYLSRNCQKQLLLCNSQQNPILRKTEHAIPDRIFVCCDGTHHPTQNSSLFIPRKTNVEKNPMEGSSGHISSQLLSSLSLTIFPFKITESVFVTFQSIFLHTIPNLLCTRFGAIPYQFKHALTTIARSSAYVISMHPPGSFSFMKGTLTKPCATPFFSQIAAASTQSTH